MKTDRELLELAAQAAGYDVAWNEEWKAFQHKSPTPDKHGVMRHPWVPLDDDGDALRLAVKLGFGISIPLSNKRTDVVSFSGPLLSIIEAHSDDPLAATRRAIVRAAAAIGEAM